MTHKKIKIKENKKINKKVRILCEIPNEIRNANVRVTNKQYSCKMIHVNLKTFNI